RNRNVVVERVLGGFRTERYGPALPRRLGQWSITSLPLPGCDGPCPKRRSPARVDVASAVAEHDYHRTVHVDWELDWNDPPRLRRGGALDRVAGVRQPKLGGGRPVPV